MRSPFVTLLVFALVCASSVLAGPIPPPKEGQGLLVLIRPGDPGGADMLADYVFDGETPLAVTKGGTYKAVDAAPGEHMIWCQGGGDVIDVVPGQTYYVVCGLFHGFSVVDEDKGNDLVAKAKDGPPLTPDRLEGAKKRLKKFYPPMKKSFDEFRAPFPILPAPQRPEDPARGTEVPRYSHVTLELMENISSAHSRTGDRVIFRVIDAGGAWAAPDTAVEGIVLFAEPSGRGGKPGLLRVDVPGVTAADGTTVPVMGQLIAIARSRAGAANVGNALGGLIGMMMVKGRDVVNFAGERFDFWTRDAAWIAMPAAATPATQPTADAVAKLSAPIDVSSFTRQNLPRMQVAVQAEGEVSSVHLLAVGDWALPSPANAAAVRRDGEGWIADFDGWSLLRHLRVSDTPVPARFRVTLADGKQSIAEGAPAWQKSQ